MKVKNTATSKTEVLGFFVSGIFVPKEDFPLAESFFKAGIKKGLKRHKNPLEAPCVFCEYDGEFYWQHQTHSLDCPFYGIGGYDDRQAKLKEWGINV